ncbi:MAG: SufS family cysteine desulfurase [Rikenellaceae bacterium]|nr:SufS family cysteine desulfurase [Rikenellaceae bacterium]
MFDVEQIRKEFPILEREVYGKRLIYLDSAATAQKPKCVVERMSELLLHDNANIHRGVHLLSEEMTARYEEAREVVRQFIGAECREEVVFTSGATMSLNLVASSWCENFLHDGDNIVVSHIEHHSNIVPWQLATERKGAELRVIPVDDSGALELDALDTLIDERTKAVAVTQASNTLGTCPDLATIIAKAHSVGAVVVVDGCQGVVHGGVDVKALDCDFYAFSGHKLYGPTGIGVLYGKRELLDKMPPYMGGGDMVDKVTFAKTTYAPLPLKFEAGTSNYIAAIGLAEAIKFLQSLNAEEVARHERAMLDYATEQLLQIDGLRIYGTTEGKAPIVSFNVEGCDHYDIGMILDKMGVAVRTGHHCAEPVMARYGTNGVVRASIALYTNKADIDALVAGVKRAVSMLK